MRCRYNAVKLSKTLAKTYHSLPVKARYGVSFVDTISDIYSGPATTVMYAIFCNIGPRYNCTGLYLLTIPLFFFDGTLLQKTNEIWRYIMVVSQPSWFEEHLLLCHIFIIQASYAWLVGSSVNTSIDKCWTQSFIVIARQRKVINDNRNIYGHQFTTKMAWCILCKYNVVVQTSGWMDTTPLS